MAYPNPSSARVFWRDAFDWRYSITPHLIGRILTFGGVALCVSAAFLASPWSTPEFTHLQYTGGVLALLLVLRTNAGYERWWEGRRLWGAIVNQSRNLAVSALTFGPREAAFREQLVRWSAAFCHASRCSLRGQREAPELHALLGADASAVLEAEHMPTYVSRRIAELLHAARGEGQLDGWAFLAIDRERAALLDHIGGCERILKTPLPLVHTIKLRRFILLYLVALPFVVVTKDWWFAPLVTSLVAYPLLAIDQIAQELQSPFSEARLSHLPLEAICETIQGNLLALLDEGSTRAR